MFFIAYPANFHISEEFITMEEWKGVFTGGGGGGMTQCDYSSYSHDKIAVSLNYI